jgi:hypothetical protein
MKKEIDVCDICGKNIPVIEYKNKLFCTTCINELYRMLHTKYTKKHTSIQQIGSNGDVIAIFPSMTCAENELGASKGTISQAIRRNGKSGGFYWKKA